MKQAITAGKVGIISVGVVVLSLCGASAVTWAGQLPPAPPAAQAGQEVQFPKPQTDGKMSVERAIAVRRSVREYAPDPLTWAEIGQLAWSGLGITDADGVKRAAPSAGNLHPMELYFVTADGIFRYVPKGHQAVRVIAGNRRADLVEAAQGREPAKQSPCVFVVTMVMERAEPRYKERALHFGEMEAGHIVENILLQAVALGLAAVPMAGFTPEKVSALLELKAGEQPIYMAAIGRPKPR